MFTKFALAVGNLEEESSTKKGGSQKEQQQADRRIDIQPAEDEEGKLILTDFRQRTSFQCVIYAIFFKCYFILFIMYVLVFFILII